MNRFLIAPALVACSLLLAPAASARAAFLLGTQGIADIGSPTINTTSLATATVFYMDDLLTTKSETGDFANPKSTGIDLGSAVFDLNNAAAFTFGNAQFGTFGGVTSVVTGVNIDGVRSFLLTGTFSPGTQYGSAPPISASFTVSFTQTNGGGMAISDSGTLSVPAATAVPEPASMVMLGLGLVGVAAVGRRRRA